MSKLRSIVDESTCKKREAPICDPKMQNLFKKSKGSNEFNSDDCVPLWDRIQKVVVAKSQWPVRSRLDVYLSNNPDLEEYHEQDTDSFPPSKSLTNSTSCFPVRTSSKPEKLKTIMDISYEIMSAEMSKKSIGKSDIYDHWLDMSLADKQKYIILAKEKIRSMNPEELSSKVELTSEEASELGVNIKLNLPEAVAGSAVLARVNSYGSANNSDSVVDVDVSSKSSNNNAKDGNNSMSYSNNGVKSARLPKVRNYSDDTLNDASRITTKGIRINQNDDEIDSANSNRDNADANDRESRDDFEDGEGNSDADNENFGDEDEEDEDMNANEDSEDDNEEEDDEDEDDEDMNVNEDFEEGEDDEEEDEDDGDSENYDYDASDQKKSRARYLLASNHGRSARFQSMNTSSYMDEGENGGDGDNMDAGDGKSRAPLNLNFLQAEGSEKHKPPAVGLRSQAIVQPWVPIEDRLEDKTNRLEKELAHLGKCWDVQDSDQGVQFDLTNAFLYEAFAVLKSVMYSKLMLITSKRGKPSHSPSSLSPIVDGLIMCLRSDCCESLLQIFHDMDYNVDASINFLKQRCAENDEEYIISWSKSDQERAFTAFSKFGEDVARISATVPTKDIAEVVDYFFRFMEAGKFLEADCNIENCIERANIEAASLNKGEKIDHILRGTTSCDEGEHAGIGPKTVAKSLNKVSIGEMENPVSSSNAVSVPEDKGQICDNFPQVNIYSANDILHKFDFPDSLKSSLPNQLVQIAKNMSLDAVTCAKRQALKQTREKSSKGQDDERRENGALSHLQKLKTIAFMIKAKRTLDDVCFTFLMNALTGYRRSALSIAELVVRIRWICNFSRDNPFQQQKIVTGQLLAFNPSIMSESSPIFDSICPTETDTNCAILRENEKVQSTDNSAPFYSSDPYDDLFRSFLEFMPRPVELLCAV